ncbi:MAG: ATP-binding protein [Gemmatimonadota bacterium]|jgi:signal transduction histidine kinase
MGEADLIERLAALSSMAEIPRDELEWLVAHGNLERYEAGALVGGKGARLDRLIIVLEGRMPIHVDRGTGPRWVMEWRAGDVTGRLPYSRMTESRRDVRVEEDSEFYALHEMHFPEMIRNCPVFTEHTVHFMLDRARRFNATDLQEEKMVSLGRLAAGLAHELNNPASAAVRGAKLLLAGLTDADAAARTLTGATLTDAQLGAIARVLDASLTTPARRVHSPIERADREEEIGDWLARHRSEPGLAASLAETAVAVAGLDALADELSGDTLDAVLRWLAWLSSTRSLAADVESAATRIADVVNAVKRFTYMDNLAGPEIVDVESGLRDTLGMLAAKVSSKDAVVTLDCEAGLPSVRASGGELNQVWMHLIDNALDAIPRSGHVDISACRELDRVTVRVIDDGPGIHPDALPRIFDPFFTTKEPGQGTGLGLEIARRLVRHCHGDIVAESRPGRTEFRVSLDGVVASGEVGPAADGIEA